MATLYSYFYEPEEEAEKIEYLEIYSNHADKVVFHTKNEVRSEKGNLIDADSGPLNIRSSGQINTIILSIFLDFNFLWLI